MPVSFRILPRHFLVYFRVEGVLETAEAIRTAQAFRNAPGYRKGMRQLVDLSGLVGWNRDYAAIMKEQARQLDIHDDPHRPTLIVILAPHAEAVSHAQAMQTPWERTHRAIMVTVDSEVEALTVLGIGMPSVAALLESA